MFAIGMMAGMGVGIFIVSMLAAVVLGRPMEAQEVRLQRLEQVCAIDRQAMAPVRAPKNMRMASR